MMLPLLEETSQRQVAAEKSRGQAAGIYIDRKEILHGRIDQMDKEQVMKEIERLQKEFPALAVVTEDNMVIEGTVQKKTTKDPA